MSQVTKAAARNRKHMLVARRPRVACIGICAGVIFLFLVVFVARPFFKSNSATTATTSTKISKDVSHDHKNGPSARDMQRDVTLRQGTASGVAYYYCSTSMADDRNNNKNHPTQQSLVLLHGAKFNKEDWKASGILSMFCSPSQQEESSSVTWSVVALDLSVTASHSELAHVLDAIETAQLVTKPVTLVTPSASGKCMVDWLLQQPQQQETSSSYQLERYIHRWIPIASGAIQQLDDAAVKRVANSLLILAIYGNRDKGGKVLSEKLQNMAGPQAKILEIKGGHPCYLESPIIFFKAVVDFVMTTTTTTAKKT